jgi:hypothetical protein
VEPFTNPRHIGLGKCKLFEREGLCWFSELDCWVDFKRKRVFRHRFVLAATFVSLCADVAAESRIPGVWESNGSPLDPSEWKAILAIAVLRRQTTTARIVPRAIEPTTTPRASRLRREGAASRGLSHRRQ